MITTTVPGPRGAACVVIDRDGNRLAAGDRVVSFRGEPSKLVRVSRLPGGGSTGKVIVTPVDDDPEPSPLSLGEYYPSVFGLKISEAE